jgi:hypothetical protein
MLVENERQALLAKGRLLFDSCSADNGYACVLGYIDHNLVLGGWRAEVIVEFIGWLKQQREAGNHHSEHAAAILWRLEDEENGGVVT